LVVVGLAVREDLVDVVYRSLYIVDAPGLDRSTTRAALMTWVVVVTFRRRISLS
jgi:hypothetical protein